MAYRGNARLSMTKCPAFLLAAALLGAPWLAPAQDDSFKAPDRLVLRDGRTIHGLILKNSRDAVLIQERLVENLYPKSEIVRIVDVPDEGMEFTDALRKGDLPSWRAIANDLRTHDNIRSLVEIPATIIDAGVFKNVPYKSFRVNGDVELNIYGDPEDPAGIELGIYGPRRNSPRLRAMLRNYLNGFLTTRAEVAAMYSLPLDGGKATAGNITIEIAPPTDPDAYGAWWISLYNEKDLAEVRLDDKEYARLTRPMEEVVDRRGRVRANAWGDQEMAMAERADAGDTVILRGFYRDENGDFRLITANSPRLEGGR